MIDKGHILAEIRRTALENGGKPLGRDRFTKSTGIGAGDWERYWPRWSDAVKEAGLEPNAFQDRFNDDVVLAQLVDEVRRFGRLPTSRELRIRHRQDPSIPYDVVYRRFGSRAGCARKLVDYCRDRPNCADVLTILEPTLTAPELETDGGDESTDFGFVYLMKSGRYYKVGRSNSVGRREYELAIQLPEPLSQVHVIKTDDPAGIERYWHTRFADRHKNGEWFELTAADVRAFKRRKSFM